MSEKNLCSGSHLFVGRRKDGPENRDCPSCGKTVRVRRNGRLWDHIDATKAAAA